MEAMKDLVATLVDNSDWVAFLVVVAALLVALILVLLTLPALVLSEPAPPFTPVGDLPTPKVEQPSNSRSHDPEDHVRDVQQEEVGRLDSH